MPDTEAAVAWALQIAADDSHGYDQANRWGPDYDCSSLVIQAFENASFGVKSAGATYTGNMRRVFQAKGFEVLSAFHDLRRGDVLLNDAHHTAIYIGGGQLVEASSNEHGKVTGGAPGDQTGREIRVREYYWRPWDCALRWPHTTGSEGGGSMEFIYRPNGANYLNYYDGHKIHSLGHADEMAAIQMAYRGCYGREIPIFDLGTATTPWASRFSDAVNSWESPLPSFR